MKCILLLALLAVLGLLVGCSWTEQTRETIHERNTVTGTVAAMPVELHHDRVVERNESSEGTRDSGLGDLAAGLGQAAAGGGSLLTGGASGLALGLLGMGVTWWQKRKAETALTQVVTGFESAKQALPPESVECLHNSLSKSMDTSSKARVKQAKGRIP
jgi:hypothetical protein